MESLATLISPTPVNSPKRALFMLRNEVLDSSSMILSRLRVNLVTFPPRLLAIC